MKHNDLTSLLIANNLRFRQLLQTAEKRLDETGGIPHDEFWKRVEANYQTSPAKPKKVAQRRATYRTARTRKK